MSGAPARKPAPPHSSARTIDAILFAAEAEFGAHGVDGGRMDRIGKAAGVTPQLVHHYFGSKTALYTLVLDRLSDRSFSEIAAHDYAAMPPVEGLRLFLNSIFDLYRRLPNLARVAIDQTIHRGAHVSKRNRFRDQVIHLMATFRSILANGEARGDFVAVADPDLFYVSAVTLTTSCFYNPIILQTCLGEDPLTAASIDRWRAHSADLLLRTIVAATPGIGPA